MGTPNRKKVRVSQGRLIGAEPPFNEAVQVGSASWFSWLEHASTFVVTDAVVPLTIRREYRGKGNYWYASTRYLGKFHREYVGKTVQLSAERIQELCATVNGWTEQIRSMPTVLQDPLIALEVPPLALDVQAAFPLMSSKVTVPPVRPGAVPRHEVQRRLQQGMQRPLTLITTPPGFGKTTVLAQLAATSSRPVAWLSIDAADSDPHRFWTYLLAALEQHVPSIMTTMLPWVEGNALPPSESMLTALLNALQLAPIGLTIILDDYHRLLEEQSAIHETLEFLIDHLPSDIHVIIASRTSPPLPIARWTASQRMLNLNEEDLSFTQVEARELLKQQQINIEDEDLFELDADIDGWVAGWQLVVASLEDGLEFDQVARSLARERRYMVDFLTHEVLDRLPPEIVSFLEQTSILDCFTAELCTAITGDDEARSKIAWLERGNVFLSALHGLHSWYRYHPTFANVLAMRLKRTQPNLIPALNRSASQWCLDHQLGEEAVQYAFAAQDVDLAARTIESTALTLFLEGHTSTLQLWLQRLPEGSISSRPRLGLAEAYIDFASGNLESCVATLDELHNRLIGPAQMITIGEIEALQAAAALHLGNLSACLGLAAKARMTLPHGHRLHALLDLYSGMAFAWLGYLVEAESLLHGLQSKMKPEQPGANNALDDGIPMEESIEHDIYHTALIFLAYVDWLRGDGGEAQQLMDEAQEIDATPHDIITLVAFHYVGGLMAYEHHHLPLATDHFTQLVQAANTPALEALGQVGLAMVATTGQTQAQAEVRHSDLLTKLSEMPLTELTFLCGTQLAFHQTRHGQVEAASRWIETIAPLRLSVSPYLMAWVNLAQAQIDYAHQRPEAAHRRLRPVHSSAISGGWMQLVLHTCVLDALINAQQQKTLDASMDSLQEALVLGEQCHFARSFLDGGDAVLHLLSQVPQYMPIAGPSNFLRLLLTEFNMMKEVDMDAMAASQQTMNAPPKGKLSKREFEVLHHVLNGATNLEIARRLIIEPSTVKRHVSNILSKLRVKSRYQAAAKAISFHLVAPQVE